MIDDELYHKGANDMTIKCVPRSEGLQLLQDIHSGVCGSRASTRTLVGKIFRHGFYCPTTRDDAQDLVIKYAACQFYQRQTTKHAGLLNTINLSWSFAIWGIDIVGWLPKAKEYLFVGIDAFT